MWSEAVTRLDSCNQNNAKRSGYRKKEIIHVKNRMPFPFQNLLLGSQYIFKEQKSIQRLLLKTHHEKT